MIQELIIIGFVMRSEPNKENNKLKLEKEIQERILNLSDAATTNLMHLLGVWDDNKRVMEYTAHNIGELVTYGNNMGWDVELNIEVGRDYHIVGEHIVQNRVHTYRIYGIHDEFSDWESLLDIHALIGSIAADEKKQAVLNHIELIHKPRNK